MTDDRVAQDPSGKDQIEPLPDRNRVLGVGPPSRSLMRRATWRLRREWKSLRRLDDFAFWIVRIGALLVLVTIGTFAYGAWRLGSFWEAYSVLIGITDPHTTRYPITSLAVSMLGWLAMPAVVGAVAGVLVERSITRHRSQSIKDL